MHESHIVLKMWALLECKETDAFQRKRDRERDEKIKFATEMMKDGKISINDFLEAVANDEMMPNKGMKNLIYMKKFLIIFIYSG